MSRSALLFKKKTRLDSRIESLCDSLSKEQMQADLKSPKNSKWEPRIGWLWRRRWRSREEVVVLSTQEKRKMFFSLRQIDLTLFSSSSSVSREHILKGRLMDEDDEDAQRVNAVESQGSSMMQEMHVQVTSTVNAVASPEGKWDDYLKGIILLSITDVSSPRFSHSFDSLSSLFHRF